MTAIPESSDFTASTITEAQFKTALTNLISYLSGLLGTAGTAQDAAVALQMPLARGPEWVASSKTLTAADRGKVFGTPGGVTITLPPAATAGYGFVVAIKSMGDGTIVDGYASELIDGSPVTITLNTGESTLLVCSSAEWWTLSRGLGKGSVDGSMVKPLSAMEPLEIQAADDVELGAGMVSWATGVTSSTSTSYVTAFTATIGTLVDSGTARVSFVHDDAIDSAYDCYARVQKNGSTVTEWTLGGNSPTTRTVDVSVVAGDVLTIQHRTQVTSAQSVISSPKLTADDAYVDTKIYGRYSDVG